MSELTPVLNLLPLRGLNEVVLIEEFEQRLNIQLPPVYRGFIKNYVPIDATAIAERHGVQLRNKYSGTIVLWKEFCFLKDGEEYLLDLFLDLERIEEFLSALYEEPEVTLREGYLPIARFYPCGFLYLGILPANADKVYFFCPIPDCERSKDGYRFLEDTIFGFLRKCMPREWDSEDNHLETYNLSYQDIYKSWGDLHWKPREYIKPD